jgi:hypothetical protein
MICPLSFKPAIRLITFKKIAEGSCHGTDGEIAIKRRFHHASIYTHEGNDHNTQYDPANSASQVFLGEMGDGSVLPMKEPTI